MLTAGSQHQIPDHAAVLEQLDRIVKESKFQASERNRRFLRYIVEEALAGRGDRIKAYTVATMVFDRGEGFDPQTDPIVRVEAGRLRRALERYYLTTGERDPVRILIPTGSYVPSFQVNSIEAATASPPTQPTVPAFQAPEPRLSRRLILPAAFVALIAGWLMLAWTLAWPPFASMSSPVATARSGPAIFVVPFEDSVSSDSSYPDLSRGLTRAIVANLTRFKDLFVFGAETSFKYGSNADQAVDKLGVDYILTGATVAISDRFRIQTSLIDAKSNQYLWSKTFEGSLAPTEFIRIQDAIANEVAGSLAQPYGVIFADKVKEIAATPPQELTSYQCVLQFQVYWREMTAELFRHARDCLERAIVADPNYAEAFASLALVYIDAYRFPLDKASLTFDPLTRAQVLARRAIELAPEATRGYKALQLAYWFARDLKRSFEAAEQGYALNPNDSEMMAELGFRLCLTGNWQRGLPLVKAAYLRNPGLPDSYRVVTFLDLYLHGQYEDALAEAQEMELPNIIYAHAIRAMAYAQLGRTAEAGAAVHKMLEIDPTYGDHVIEDLTNRNLYPELIEKVVEGLEKAGLPVKRGAS